MWADLPFPKRLPKPTISEAVKLSAGTNLSVMRLKEVMDKEIKS
jgi:hypothetical protein